MKWSEEYVVLALNINRHLPGFVDSFFGPGKLKRIRLEKKGFKSSCDKLLNSIPYKDDLNYEFLKSQIEAMKAVVRIINGEEIPYKEKIELIFGIKPRFQKFKPLSEEELRLIDGLRKKHIIQETDIVEVSGKVMEQCRNVTDEKLGFLPIPENRVEFRVTREKPWSAYNWYIGGLCSIIDINLDVPHTFQRWIRTVAHEVFPGHHLEHAIKESEIYRKKGLVHASVLLTLAPESIISEGIACNAWKIIFSNHRGLLDFSNKEFGTDYDKSLSKVMRRAEELSSVSSNAALMYHSDKKSKEEVIGYLMENLRISRKEAEQRFSFIGHDIWGLYLFNYDFGEKLIEGAVGNKEAIEPVYTEQLVPLTFKRFLD